MSANRLTNLLLLTIAILLGVLAIKPAIISNANAAARKAWQNYVPITALEGWVAFFDKETGDYLLYNYKQNTLRKLGNVGSAQIEQ